MGEEDTELCQAMMRTVVSARVCAVAPGAAGSFPTCNVVGAAMVWWLSCSEAVFYHQPGCGVSNNFKNSLYNAQPISVVPAQGNTILAGSWHSAPGPE